MAKFGFFNNNLSLSRSHRGTRNPSVRGGAITGAVFFEGVGGLSLWAGSDKHPEYGVSGQIVCLVTGVGLVLLSTFVIITAAMPDRLYDRIWGNDPLSQMTNEELTLLEDWYLKHRNDPNFEENFIKDIFQQTGLNFGSEEYKLQQAYKHLGEACTADEETQKLTV